MENPKLKEILTVAKTEKSRNSPFYGGTQLWATLRGKIPPELLKQFGEFETRIRTYQGNDPLSDWVKFIEWIESICPETTEDGSLLCIAVKQFCHIFYAEGKESKKYFDDPRFVKLWITMTEFTSPLATFAFMYQHGIGLRCPDVYLSWSRECEDAGDPIEAVKILRRGIEHCKDSAADVSTLREARKAILTRLETLHHLEGKAVEIFEPQSAASDGDHDKVSSAFHRTNNTMYCTARDELSMETVSPDQIQARRTTISTSETVFINRTSHMRSSLADSAYGASIHERTGNFNGIKSTKKPRDSLCIPRYNKLHTGRVDPFPVKIPLNSHARDKIEDRDKIAATSQSHPEKIPEDREKIAVISLNHQEKIPQVQAKIPETTPPPSAEPEKTGDIDWGLTEYHVIVPPQIPPPGAADIAKQELVSVGMLPESAPGPSEGQRFMWNHSQCPSGIQEVSFEERLERIYYRRIKLELLQREKNLVNERTMLQQKILDLQKEIQSLTANLRSLEDNEKNACLFVNSQESRIRELEKQLMSEQRARRSAEDRLLRMEKISKQISGEVSACLTQLSKDICRSDIPIINSLDFFVHNLHKQLEVCTVQDKGELTDFYCTAADYLTEAIQEIKSRPLAKIFNVTGVTVAKSNETMYSYEMSDDPDMIASDQDRISGVPSVGASGSASHLTKTSSEKSNPVIKAMWNQTLSTTARDPSKILSDGSSLENRCIIPRLAHTSVFSQKPPVTAVDGPLQLPMRQALSTKKSARTLQTSAINEAENQPMLAKSSAAAFDIFHDVSALPEYLPPVQPKENALAVEKDDDDDSENTPPLDSEPSPKSRRNIAGVLNDSAEIQAAKPEDLAENDFIDVPSSDSENEVENPVVNILPDPTPPQVSDPPPKLPRRSLPFGLNINLNDEFDITMDEGPSRPRKSIGPVDQTLPLITQSEFYRHIDPSKASTPLVTTMTEQKQAELMRAKGRPSYLPPANLSPIGEASREKTRSTVSSTQISASTKSIKSFGNAGFNPISEN